MPRKVSFQSRLKRCQRDGNMTVADLSRWFDRPYATARSWVNGVEPGGGPIDREHAAQVLGLLETLIRQRRGFPVPRLAPQGRIRYLAHVRGTFLAVQPNPKRLLR